MKWLTFPTMDDVQRAHDTADRKLLCKWYRYLPASTNEKHALIMLAIVGEYNAMGGMTPQISKAIDLEMTAREGRRGADDGNTG